jgi:hypothetical protein
MRPSSRPARPSHAITPGNRPGPKYENVLFSSLRRFDTQLKFFFRLFQKVFGLNTMTSHVEVILDADVLYLLDGLVNMHANSLYIVPIMHRLGQGKTNSNTKNSGTRQQQLLHRDSPVIEINRLLRVFTIVQIIHLR